jgi:zeaxanthin glucosyltransferase
VSRIGFFNPPSIGHLYPAMALGRHLAERGHEITFFNYSTAKAAIRKAGLAFYPIAISPEFNPPSSAGVHTGLSSTRKGLLFGARTILAQARDALAVSKVELLVIDQLDLAAGTAAEYLGLPFITLAILPPVFLHSSVSPVGFSWSHHKGISARIRNRIGNALFRNFMAPVFELVNEQRHQWALPKLKDVNDIFSKLAIITQLPESFDFPIKPKPPNLFHTGPFIDKRVRRISPFPWERLDSKPLVYASMGTIRNDSREAFKIIAEACVSLDVQLVISLGGNEMNSALPGNPLVVSYAPQLDLIRRASVVITHAGINTTLESLAEGVPLVAIPVSDDQPSVAARIDWIGAGKVLPFQKLSVPRLRENIRQVLGSPRFKESACRMKAEIQDINGLEIAADLIENLFGGLKENHESSQRSRCVGTS